MDNEFNKQKSRELSERKHRESMDYRKERDANNILAKRNRHEAQMQTALDVAVQKGDISVELLQKQFELAPGYSDVEFEDYVRRENVRLQSLQVELDMRTQDNHERYTVEKKSLILKAMITVLNLKQENNEARTKHQENLELERLKHENNKDFEILRHNLATGNTSTDKEVMTPDELEAASKAIREQNQSMTKDEQINDFINEPKKK